MGNCLYRFECRDVTRCHTNTDDDDDKWLNSEYLGDRCQIGQGSYPRNERGKRTYHPGYPRFVSASCNPNRLDQRHVICMREEQDIK